MFIAHNPFVVVRGGAGVAVPACFHLADDVFPRVRAEAARRLIADGWSQSRAAQALGVSQAMVSKYLGREAVASDALVERLVADLVQELHAPTPAAISPWCTTLTARQERPGADEALSDLLAAERRLLAEPPMAVMPEVGLNIARCTRQAATADDVLAYPARIVAAADRLVRPVAPEFGASRHLAACLLALRGRDPDVHAIANIRGGPAIRKAAGATVELRGRGDRERLYARAVHETPARLVHDPGAVGYEPCLYVAGPTASAVVDRILDICQKVRT